MNDLRGINENLTRVLTLADTIRAEIPESKKEIKELGITRIELVVDDNRKVASSLAAGDGGPTCAASPQSMPAMRGGTPCFSHFS